MTTNTDTQAHGGRVEARGLLPEDQPTAWPPLKKALWLVVTGERLNDGRYVNAYELTDKLFAAALAASPASPAAAAGVDAQSTALRVAYKRGVALIDEQLTPGFLDVGDCCAGKLASSDAKER